ncbi:bud emergence protein 1 [Rhodotorula kratochvilovae]
MKGIRRSLNKERIGAPSGAVKTSVPPPSAYGQRPTAAPAPAPPKRVIRATAAYRARGAQELSFEEGDFFHVVSDEGGEDWFDAANPMTGMRGLVPASHFQVLGRNVRETQLQGPGKKSSIGSSGDGGSGPSSPHDAPGASVSSGGGWKAGAPYGGAQASAPAASVSPTGSGKGRPPSQSAAKHQPLYGVVQYDFIAERPDELDAKRGEPIIVIAQSNHEWFVAKPIGRLGGPGLIPVAFVEIQDMATGKPVENVEELIRSAVVPKVEEWKKMTADYKQASIPLGRFDFAQPADSTSSSSNAAIPSSSSAPPPQHQSVRSSYDTQHQYAQAYHSPTGDALSPSQNDSYDPRYSYSRERRQYGLVTSASVESFHQEEGSFWFHLRAFFSTGASLVLYRLYQDFYDFQIALMDEFPVEAGRLPGEDGQAERILPMMPGPTEHEDENVCAQRVLDLSIYLADLCTLPERIRGSGLMYEFLVPRAGDVEVVPGVIDYGADASPAPSQGIENQYGELVDYLDQLDNGGGASARGSGERQGYARGGGADVADQMGRMSLNGGRRSSEQYSDGAYQRQSQQQQQQLGGFDERYEDDYYNNQAPPSTQPARAPMGNANQNVPFIKIKIFHRNTDDLIAIRVPPTVSLGALLDKVRERLGSDVTHLRFREEGGGAGAQLVSLHDDDDLERWVRSGAKLVLYAD